MNFLSVSDYLVGQTWMIPSDAVKPVIIDEKLKMFYYRGLKEWKQEKGYLTDTCLAAQDQFKVYLDYFRIEYDK